MLRPRALSDPPAPYPRSFSARAASWLSSAPEEESSREGTWGVERPKRPMCDVYKYHHY